MKLSFSFQSISHSWTFANFISTIFGPVIFPIFDPKHTLHLCFPDFSLTLLSPRTGKEMIHFVSGVSTAFNYVGTE